MQNRRTCTAQGRRRWVHALPTWHRHTRAGWTATNRHGGRIVGARRKLAAARRAALRLSGERTPYRRGPAPAGTGQPIYGRGQPESVRLREMYFYDRVIARHHTTEAGRRPSGQIRVIVPYGERFFGRAASQDVKDRSAHLLRWAQRRSSATWCWPMTGVPTLQACCADGTWARLPRPPTNAAVAHSAKHRPDQDDRHLQEPPGPRHHPRES
jgi:hypothetical protein